jgi:hypothetical protein
LFLCQPWNIAVRDSPHSVLGNLGSHIPVVLVHDKVAVTVSELLKGIVDLEFSLC